LGLLALVVQVEGLQDLLLLARLPRAEGHAG